MKTLFTALLTVAAAAATAKSLEVTVPNVRSDKGTILVMAVVAGSEKPVFGMAQAKKGSVTVTLEGLEGDIAEVSLFHDENGNRKMDTSDRGPTEGYATKKCKTDDGKTSVKMNLYYPSAE